MQLNLSHSIGGRRTDYPAPVISNLVVRSPTGQPHSRLWDGIIDTGADLVIVPREIANELHLARNPERVRVWTYRKDEPPRELDIYYVELGLESGFSLLAKAITAERRTILIGRAALMKMQLMINWPANRWRLEEASFAGPGNEP